MVNGCVIYYGNIFVVIEIKDYLSTDLGSEHLQPLNEKKRKDMLRLVEGLLTSVYSVNPSLRPRMNTPGQSEQPKPPPSKPPLKAPLPSMVPRTLPDEEEDPQEEYLPMQAGSPEVEPEDYEAPTDVMMPDGNQGDFDQDELYEELPAEDGAQGPNDEPEDYEDPGISTSSANLNQVPLPPRVGVRSPGNGFEEPGYQPPTSKLPEDRADGVDNFEPWQYARTMRDKKVSTTDLKKADCKGMLEKLGGRGHNTWQKRYCILDTSLLYFFKDEKSKNFNNFIEAYAYSVSEAPDKTKEKKHQFSFVLTCRESGKDYYFRTTSAEDRERWINALRKCAPSTTSTQGPGSMQTLQRGGNVVEPIADDFQCECYEDIPAMGGRIQSEGESDEENFENRRPARQFAPPTAPKMPPPPPPPAETFDQDQLYDEHPVEDEPEEEYLACESDLQQDIIESAASPLEIVVDTNRVYEATDNGVNYEKVYVSLYDFNAEEDDEMSLQRGDLVCVMDSTSSPNWWLAELITPDIVKTNKKGYCPANFLTLAFEQL